MPSLPPRRVVLLDSARGVTADNVRAAKKHKKAQKSTKKQACAESSLSLHRRRASAGRRQQRPNWYRGRERRAAAPVHRSRASVSARSVSRWVARWVRAASGRAAGACAAVYLRAGAARTAWLSPFQERVLRALHRSEAAIAVGTCGRAASRTFFAARAANGGTGGDAASFLLAARFARSSHFARECASSGASIFW